MLKLICQSAALVVTTFILLSCVTKVNSRPDWVNNPGKGHIGKCGTHIKGLIYQEQCAYKKGLTYIAMTKGVTADITANMDIAQSSHGTGTSRGALKANIHMQGKEIQIKGKIVEKWHDRVNDVFYVLIFED